MVKAGKIFEFIGIALFFLGFGWFLGRRYGEIGIEFWKLLLIILGLALIAISFAAKKKSK